MSSHAARLDRSGTARDLPGLGAIRLNADVLLPLGIGAILAAIALGAGGGLQLAPTTEVEMALDRPNPDRRERHWPRALPG